MRMNLPKQSDSSSHLKHPKKRPAMGDLQVPAKIRSWSFEAMIHQCAPA